MDFRVSSKVFLLLAFAFAFSLPWTSLGVRGETSISEEEDAELERQLKIINKPAIKVIKTDYGDIYDCVDINKQPAFDHPSLKNHKIQMRPTAIPRDISNKASSMEEPSTIKPSKIGLMRGCPLGTVPIRRTQKEDLIRVKSIPKRDPTNIEPQTASAPGHHFAGHFVNDGFEYHGGGGWINLYNPTVLKNQFSSSGLWIKNGESSDRNVVQAGWTVNPRLYGDNLTRLYTYWTGDGYHKTGCFNILCAGFVQISTIIPIGLPYEVSVIDGIQKETHVVIYQDSSSGNWWLWIQDETQVGYWPKSLFTSLASFASTVLWGSEVYGPPGEASPPMGSGQLPSEGLNKACFLRTLQVILELDLIDVNKETTTRLAIDHPNCYSADKIEWYTKIMKYYFFFGGPGGMDCGV